MILPDSAPLARAFAQTLTSLIVHIIVLQERQFQRPDSHKHPVTFASSLHKLPYI